MKTLVLGLGNPILTDDGVGIHIVRAVAGRLHRSDVTVKEASVGGLRLLDVIAGYDRLILVDAIQTDGPPGQARRLGPHDTPSSLHAGSSHDLSLGAALELGRRLGMDVPAGECITIVAVEAADVVTFGEGCTPPVQAAIPHAVQVVLDEIDPSSRTWL